MKNQRPDKIQVRVEASDPDNERVRLDYEWVVNGKLPNEHRNVLGKTGSKRNNVIVTIIASDGKGETKKRLPLTIANASPFWLEDPRFQWTKRFSSEGRRSRRRTHFLSY